MTDSPKGLNQLNRVLLQTLMSKDAANIVADRLEELERENAALRVENAALKKSLDRLEQKFAAIDAKSDKADNSAIKRPTYQT